MLIGGHTLPAYSGEIPIERGPTLGTCPLAITGGWLTLDVAGGRFAYAMDERNMCSGAIVSVRNAEGIVAAAGPALRFGTPLPAISAGNPVHADPMPADTVWFPGSLDRQTVTVHSDDVMVFRRHARVSSRDDR